MVADNAVSVAVFKIAGGKPAVGGRRAAIERAAVSIGVDWATVYRWIRWGGVADSGDLVAVVDALERAGAPVTVDDVRALAYYGRRHARAG